jgi:uncharacterized protein (TIGR03083 family)
MLHESIVHRWDAQMGAGGAVDPIESDMAADGIDEFLDVFVDITRAQRKSPAGPTVLIQALDSGHSWTTELPPAGRAVRRGAHAADVQVSGDASDLLLLLWGRLRGFPQSVEVVGPISDPVALTALLPSL